ncbi:hypothetical protein ALC62_04639 [Cyphomyrmex costatus]|uniref:Uncharacterized protein n=1 Tax=Cyphomyrmex costatus TaxID=456900 RepID=A0A195CUT3_9HYME|nr:hypothetical protein ALC62_04639 [Cyphomyrmex costatus]
MVAGPPPPPPPLPPVSGHLPAMRINTTETATAKRPQVVSNDVYEPPAAIQNAMLTKDKKPFTYTPGMGGKLDLSQIRSPRMARRVAKNANDEGIEGPPKSAIESKQSPAVPVATNLLVPQVAVPVFPSNVPPQPPLRMSQSPSVNRTLSNAVDKQAEPVRNITKVDTKIPITVTSSQSSTPESPSTPTLVTLAKAPTPWMQNKNKPQEELPEWAKRTNVNKTVGSDSSENSVSPIYVQVQQASPQCSQAKQKQEQKQYSVPQNQQTKPQQIPQQPQQQQQQRQNINSVTSQQTNSQSHHEHVVPIRMEDRPSVFDAKRESGHHQFTKQPPTVHHQQRWGQGPAQHTFENQAQNHPQNQKQPQIHVTSRPEQSAGTTYIIPLVVEGSEKRNMPPTTENNVKIGKPARIVVQQRSPDLNQQCEPGPIQSRSFRVLQKITDTDELNDVGTEQIRKMELSEDEKLLMNKFKEQVDQEIYLHQEKDPRYRGAAIPSRAFRFLQNMTDSNDASVTCAVPQNVVNKRQNRNSKSFEETQANLPPSEQQVQEPKKYTGSAIPSRSFKILQAMTSSENNATQENRQADYTCRTENNLPGNQQDAFFSPRPVSFWSHSEGWWGYYPVQYNAPSSKSANEADERSFPYLRYPDENACVGYEFFYPVSNENFTGVARVNDQENSSGQYGYVAVICPQAGYNDVQSHVDENNSNYVHNRYACVHSSPAQDDSYFVQDDSINESRNTLPNDLGVNHLNLQSTGTHNPKNVYENYNSDKNGIKTAMNIVDEEDDTSDGPNKTMMPNNIEKSKKTFGLHINVPNYTYIDTSDSSDSSDSNDSSDSSDSVSDNEHFSDSCQKYCNDTTSNNTLSNSDSDSYEGYSIGLNPYEKLKKNLRNVSSSENCTDLTTYSECSNVDNSCRHSQSNSESSAHGDRVLFKKNDYSNDQNSCTTSKQDFTSKSNGYNEKGYMNNQSNLDASSLEESSKMNSESNRVSNTEQSDQQGVITDNVVPHQLSIIYEDVERLSSESLYCGSKKKIDEQNEASFEMTDDPSDDTEATMVSVSLPLKFKFSVSEDNEDITTVTVGNSKIKAERSCGGRSAKNDTDNDVCANFHVGNDTSVNFTVTRHVSDATGAATSTKNNTSIAVPHVDFTFKKDSTNVSGNNFKEQNTEAEFPVTKTEYNGINVVESASKNVDDCTASKSEMAMGIIEDGPVNDKNCSQAESACNNFESIDVDRKTTDCESKLGSWMQNFETHQTVDTEDRTNQKDCCVIVDDDRCVNSDRQELCQTDMKYLLSVGDSRENTDDEDSGVTSDTSRMISEIDTECREIDTDSECTRKQKKYQRTQTHSRLFRLLNDDSILSDSTTTDPCRKEYLSLPLKTNAFNYDDSYCSNYSSGLTSPEYSPIHEQSCRKFHDTAMNGNTMNLSDGKVHQPAHQPEIPSKDNSYFLTWKSTKLPSPQEHDVMPSLAFKILNSKTPFWTYKVNVLCPRIKSTKSVPQALLAQQIDQN